MSILIRGKTRCAICGNVIYDDEAAVGFPNIIMNEADPLYPLSDESCHLLCAQTDALGSLMLAVTEQFERLSGPGRRKCAACGREVVDPDDHLFIAYLVDPVKSELGRFNFTNLHKSHVQEWPSGSRFVELANAMLTSGEWHGEQLSDVLRRIAP